MPLMHDSDVAWKEFGKTEPYFAVCTQPQFRSENLTSASRAEFFKSGEEHVRAVLRIVCEQLVPDFQPATALDFGCGVGRLVIPLAGRCQRVVGVDVSTAMLEEAQRNCAERGLTNVQFYDALDRIPGTCATFDLVHTFIVLQHIPVSRGLAIVESLIQRVADGGVGVLHLTYWREASRLRKLVNGLRRQVPLLHNLLNVAQGWPFGRPLMQMNDYPLNQVTRLLYQNGCHNVVLRFTNHSGHLGAVLLFRKERLADFS